MLRHHSTIHFLTTFLIVVLALANSPPGFSQPADSLPVVASTTTPGAEDRRDIAPLEGGSLARILENPRPFYPVSSRAKGEEGWVQVSYVIDAEGRVVDPVIEDSSGVPALERSALAAIAKVRYEPATWRGKPVEQCAAQVRVNYVISNMPRGVTPDFRKPYGAAVEALKAGDLKEAQSQVSALLAEKGHLQYELSLLYLLQGEIAVKQGNSPLALRAYRRAMAIKDRIDPKVRPSVKREIFRLEVETQDWANALHTYHRMSDAERKAAGPEAEKVAQEIEAAINGDKPIGFDGLLEFRSGCAEGRPNWQHTLLRQKFAFVEADANAKDFELRCDWRRISGQVNTEQAWEVPEDWGWCQLFVFGDVGAKLKLVEYPNTPADERRVE